MPNCRVPVCGSNWRETGSKRKSFPLIEIGFAAGSLPAASIDEARFGAALALGLVLVQREAHRHPHVESLRQLDAALGNIRSFSAGISGNVAVEYGGEPVGKVWAFLGRAKEAGSRDTFVIYGDETDLAARFKPAALAKYAGPLQANGQIELRTTARITSATAVRRAIGAGDFATFKAEMPKWLDARRAWDILTHATAEGLVREYVRTLVRMPA